VQAIFTGFHLAPKLTRVMAYCEETIGTMHNYASNTSRKSRAICGIKGLLYAAGAAVIRRA
jgi:hypothetical protein